MRPEPPEPLARPRVLLAGDPSARPAGLERALTGAGFQLVERQESSVDPEADAILITLDQVEESTLRGLLPVTNNRPVPAPRIVIFAAADPDAPATALSLGAADALAAPVHLPELCARVHTRIRERLGAERAPHEQQLREAAEAFIQPGLHPDELALALVRRLARTFDLAHCSFASIAPDGQTMRVLAEVQRPEPGKEFLELSRHPEIAEAIKTRRTVIRPVHAHQPADAPRTVIVLPVETRDRVAGTLLLGTSESQRRLSPVQLEFAAGLARAAAEALEEGRPEAVDGGGPGEHSGAPPHADDAQALDKRMREEFERARRYSLSFSLILLGVDELRSVRERLGAEAADRLKREVADVLRRELRVPDFVVSYGASEFAIVLPETGPAGARRSVIRVRERLSVVPSDRDPRLEHPRFSAGIVTYPHPAVSQSDELYAMVEAALMRGKAQSGERIGVAV